MGARSLMGIRAFVCELGSRELTRIALQGDYYIHNERGVPTHTPRAF